MEDLHAENSFSNKVGRIVRGLRTAAMSVATAPKETITEDPETGLPVSPNTGHYIIDDDIQESD